MEAGSSPEPLGFLFENPVPDLSLRGPEEREARCGPASRTANGEQDHAPILWRTKRIPFSDPEAPRKPAAPESRKPLSGTNLFPARRTSPSKAGPPPPPIPPAAHPALRPVEAAKPGREIIPKPCRRAAVPPPAVAHKISHRPAPVAWASCPCLAGLPHRGRMPMPRYAFHRANPLLFSRTCHE